MEEYDAVPSLLTNYVNKPNKPNNPILFSSKANTLVLSNCNCLHLP